MNKTEIKKSPNNNLIIRLVDLYADIVCKNGQRCVTDNKELNRVSNELFNRGLLTKEDIRYLNE